MKTLITNIKNFFLGVASELKKVSWPSRKTVLNHAMVVMLSSTVVILIITVLDFGLSKGFEYFLSLKK